MSTLYAVNCMDPAAEYISRKDRWAAEKHLLDRRFAAIGNSRVATAIVIAVLLWLVFVDHRLRGWWLLLPISAFIGLAVWHRRVIARRAFCDRAASYYDRALARLETQWPGTGNAGDQFRDPSHVYAEDLDLFGKGSLFELIALTRTAAGDQTLANWLLTRATREEALARQAAIAELRGRLDLREDIALLGEDVRAGMHPDRVAKWGCAPVVAFAPWLRPLALLLSLAAVGTLAAFFAHVIPLWPFLAVLACNFLLVFLLRERVSRITEAVQTPARDLALFALLLDRLRREQFEATRLKKLNSAFEMHRSSASRRIRRLKRWMELLDSADHLFLRVARPVFLWNEQVAMGIESWRRDAGPYIGEWIAAVGEFEALSAFASLAFERPQWTFPVLLEDHGARFEAEFLQHPLMLPAKCVPNDVIIGGDSHGGDNTRLLIVSGSNMSGKSTLLRSVGLNAVLAWAGAPVAAKQLRISALQVGASIRIVDSLLEGRSRFYAEITRIRQIVDLTKSNPSVLFLFDELLSGTNSHDRRIGASGIVRGLVNSGAVGLLTTHDLALAKIERDLGAAAVNVHFDDEIVDGRIEFDYKLRPGVVVRSNAIALMRAVGLEI